MSDVSLESGLTWDQSPSNHRRSGRHIRSSRSVRLRPGQTLAPTPSPSSAQEHVRLHFVVPQTLECQTHLADGPHVPQVLSVLGEMKVSVHLQDELEVQVLPACGVMDEVGVHSLPGLILCRQRSPKGLGVSFFFFTACQGDGGVSFRTWVTDVMGDHAYGLDRRRDAIHQIEPLRQILLNHTAS